MRLVTFLVLVLRRLWAKRWLLVGSFLGATLVIALLVIVPLYEASIAEVDLRFTVRGASPVQVDISASHTLTDYDITAASKAADVVDTARSGISAWYPNVIEHTLSRELFVIPLEFPDWKAMAAAWRSDLADWAAVVGPLVEMPHQGAAAESLRRAVRDGELDEAQAAALRDAGDKVPRLGPPPYPQPPQEPTVTRMFTAPRLQEAVRVVEGSWPEASSAELEVAIGEDLARLTGLQPGDEVVLRPFISLPENFEVVRVSAVVAPRDPGDVRWRSLLPSSLVFVDETAFGLWTEPLTRDASEDPWLRTLKGFPTLTATNFWYLPLDRETVTLPELDDLSGAVQGFRAAVGRESVVVSTGLPTLVGEFDVRKTVFGGPILAMLALVVAGALYFLVYTAGLTVEREGPELALLRTRGASGWQTTGIHITQSAFISAAAAVVAPTFARLLVSATGRIPPMSDLTGGEALTVMGGRSLVPFIAAGTGLAYASMGLAIIPFVRRSILELRALSARPGRLSVWQRYYVDIFLIALAGILLFELRQRGLVDVSADPGLDPFAIASPALFLFAGALVLLRILPLILRAFGWMMTRMRGMTSALPGWHLGRDPIPYGRLALLIFLTTGFGAFALTYANTLDHSYEDRAEFAVGSDARIVAPGAGLVTPPAGSTAAAVYRSQGTARRVSRSAELLAVDTKDFIKVVNWRSDFGAGPAEVFSPLLDAQRAPLGVSLPPGTSILRIGGVEIPESWAAQALTESDEAPLQAVIRVRDGNRRLWVLGAEEPFSDAEWRQVQIPIDASHARNRDAAVMVPPLTLQAIWVEREVAAGEPILIGHELLVGSMMAETPEGAIDLTTDVAATMEPGGGLAVVDSPRDAAARAFYAQIPDGEPPPGDAEMAADPRVAPTPVRLWTVPSRNRTGAVPHLAAPPQPMAVMLDATAARVAGLDVGEASMFGIDGATIPGTVAGIIGEVPTASSPVTSGKMVVDLDDLLHWLDGSPSWSLTGNIARVTEPGELWLRTEDPDGAILQVRSRLDVDDEDFQALTINGAISSFSSRPVQIGLVSILFVGAATGVLLALAGVTGHVLVAVRKRTREMGVLRALGLRRAGVAATFAVEQLVVLVLGALIGVAGGVGLMRLMIPFLQLGEEARELIPSVLLRIDLGVLGAYLASVAVLLVVSVLLSARTVSTRDLSAVLRQGER